MDIRAFGSYYGQTATLPYASGVAVSPADGRVGFSTCRGLYVEVGAGQFDGTLAIELSDAPGQVFTLTNISTNQILPLACTAVVSGSIPSVVVLY